MNTGPDVIDYESSIFLSHNSADKAFARSLGAQLKLAGANVWFDEWEIQAGDSIPGKLNEALGAFDTFLLLWSEAAAQSGWVRQELATAITRRVSDAPLRVIPVRLDDTDLPPLLSDVRYLTVEDHSTHELVIDILGLRNDREWLKAVQTTLDEAGIAVEFYPGYGAIVGCPRCGAGLDAITSWSARDFRRDDEYAGARCTECNWSGGGEL